MKAVSFLQDLQGKYGIDRVVVACGVFDGVHRGHQRIIAALLKQARDLNAVPIAVTFTPHPRAILQPGKTPQLLTVRDQKLRLLAECGVQAAVLLPFSREMATLPPEQFLKDYLLPPGIELGGICVGTDWRFGACGKGDTNLLRELGHRLGFAVITVPEFHLYGQPISSTRIREAIAKGRLKHASRLLGRPYAIQSHVAHGKGIGTHQLHCPTANVLDKQIVLPPCGVYAARGFIDADNRREHQGIVYIGTAPTISHAGSASEPILEFHLFDFHQDLYDTTLEVEFAQFIRPDKCFESVDALGRQIQCDIAVARNVLQNPQKC